MTTQTQPGASAPAVAIDWREVARTTLGSAFVAGLVGGAVYVLGKVLEAEIAARMPAAQTAPTMPEVETDPVAEDEEDEAAALLGVSPFATESEIRAALRERLASSRLHPDHGGDGEEAKRLIAAQNLLVERARAAREA